MTTNNEGLATSFHEKPTLEGAISIGFFVLNPSVLNYLGGDDCVFERAPLRQLVRDRQLMTFHHKGFHSPMDTYRDHDYLQGLWGSGAAPWKTWST